MGSDPFLCVFRFGGFSKGFKHRFQQVFDSGGSKL